MRFRFFGIGLLLWFPLVGAVQAQAGVPASPSVPMSGYVYRETQWWQTGTSSVPYPTGMPGMVPSLPSAPVAPPVTAPPVPLPSALPDTGSAASSPLFTPGWTDQPLAPAAAVPVAHGVTVTVQPNVSEALPGTSIQYAATITNATATLLQDLSLRVQFDPHEQTMVEAPGAEQLFPGTLVWSGGVLNPGEAKVLTYTLALPPVVTGSNTVQSSVQVAGPTGVLAHAVVSVAVLRQLPATGVGDGTRPLVQTHQFLTPIAGARASSSGSPWWLWLAGGVVLLLVLGSLSLWLQRRGQFA